MSQAHEPKIALPKIATREEWLEARKALLAREKALTYERDALSAARRELPRVRVDERYVFEGPEGTRSLADLFDGQEQLVVYHLMFDPSWEAACKACSFIADHLQPTTVHLRARDTAIAAISRAPLGKIEAYKKRMGWTFRWLSSGGTDFNYDYGVSFRADDVAAGKATYNYAPKTGSNGELPGLSVFLRDGDAVYHTYSTYGRGLDQLMGTYTYLDLTPLGRHEGEGGAMAWLRRHDEYEAR